MDWRCATNPRWWARAASWLLCCVISNHGSKLCATLAVLQSVQCLRTGNRFFLAVWGMENLWWSDVRTWWAIPLQNPGGCIEWLRVLDFLPMCFALAQAQWITTLRVRATQREKRCVYMNSWWCNHNRKLKLWKVKGRYLPHIQWQNIVFMRQHLIVKRVQ